MRLAICYLPASALSALVSLIAAPSVPAQDLNDPTLKAEVIQLIRDHYYRAVTLDTALPVDKMIAHLDPHSSYTHLGFGANPLRPLAVNALGFGLWTSRLNGKCIVDYVDPNNCAGRAGVLAGDEILQISGLPVDEMDDSAITARLDDEGEWAFELLVYRRSIDSTMRFWVSRNDATQFTRVWFFGMIDDTTGYIRLDDFGAGTMNEVRWALDTLAERGMKSLLLDLRDNPGGLVNEAIALEDLFVPGRMRMAMMRSAVESEEDTFCAHAPSPYESLPLIVLVSHDSWSASELVAGSLQDLDRATIVGEATGGKALAMRYFTLSNTDNVQLAIASIVLPSGRCTQASFHDGAYDFYPPELPQGVNTHQLDALYTQMPCRNFTTAHGRTVSWHEGIIPDIVMPDFRSCPPAWYFTTLDSVALRIVRDSIAYYRRESLAEYERQDHFTPAILDGLEATLEAEDTTPSKHIAYSFEPRLSQYLAWRVAVRVWQVPATLQYITARSSIVRRALIEPRVRTFTAP